jgi:hypothetical protein
MKYTLETVYTNPFLKEFKTILIQIIEHAYRLHAVRRRVLTKWRKRRMISCNTEDLSFSSFGNNRIELIIDSKKYTFHPYELRQLILSSLLHAEQYMIVDPLPIKNPYTGISFSNELLYFLYLNMKFIPPCFRHLVHTKFDLNVFLLEYESILRQHQIHKRIRNMTKVMVRQEMQDMMVEMCVIMSYSVQLPQAVFMITQDERECRQLLTHYYNYMYSLNPYQRQCECTTLIKKITKMAFPPP